MSLTVAQLRMIEWVLFAALVLAGIAVAYVFAEGVLTSGERWGVVGLAGLVLTMKIAVQSTIDRRIKLIESQTNLTGDSAFVALYERSPVAYLTINTQGQIVDFNTAAVNLLHAERSMMTQFNFFNLIAPPGESDVSAGVLAQKIQAGMSIADQEVRIKNAQNELRWISLTVYEAQRYDERMMALVDITEQKKVDTAKSEFVALATHQLRTPVSAIRWNVELLQKKVTAADATELENYVVKIDRNVNRMINLINDFLNVSKLEMGTFATQYEPIALWSFMQDIQDEFAEKVNKAQLQFTHEVTPESAVIGTDPRLFHIIVSNLVSNAVKYVRPQGRVSVVMSVSGQQVSVMVSDTGIGIPEAEQAELFSKFFRATNAQEIKSEGTGLGLYVVQQSVAQLGGTINMKSVENEGTTFTVSIPVKVVEAG